MSDHLVLVDKITDWRAEFPLLQVVEARDYLTSPAYLKIKRAKVINLCDDYRYLGVGYYCALLGEARGHKLLPSVRTITELGSRAIYRLSLEDLDDTVEKILARHAQPEKNGQFRIKIFFGRTELVALSGLARQLFDQLRCPLLRVVFRHKSRWQVESIKPVGLAGLKKNERSFFVEALTHYQRTRWVEPKGAKPARFDMAILHDPKEALPPSSARTLAKFVRAGKKMGLNVDLIEAKDYARLAEYDALFIRETTNIVHHTYQFAKRAESEGMVVIDDPDSIVRCTNKVFLAQLLAANRLPSPKTDILQLTHIETFAEQTDYPIVLKIPDGSFSRGVVKAKDKQAFLTHAKQLFEDSDLILAQEYLYTEFDWRIGVLNRQPLFACQYLMSKNHWQIVQHRESGKFTEGGHRCFRLADVPVEVLELAVKAANLIGDGFYGVDIKQSGRSVYVIEVNDNPNVDVGVEDGVMGEGLYEAIMTEFVRRLEIRINQT